MGPVHGIILAAGKGTRLAPLTDQCPKALVPVAGRPALDRAIDRLHGAGIRHVAVNLHHHHERLLDHLDGIDPGQAIHRSVEPQILGTAGGLARIRPWIEASGHHDEPLLVHNADAATDLDLGALWTAHVRARDAATGRGSILAMTMALVRHSATDSVRIDEHERVVDFLRGDNNDRWTYSGVGIVSPALMRRMQTGEAAELVPVLEAAMAEGMEVSGWVAEPTTTWHDLGTPERYLAFHRAVLTGQAPGIANPQGRWHVDSDMPNDVALDDWGWIGSNCTIGEGAQLARCVIWDGASIEAGSIAKDRIIAPWAEAGPR